MENIKVVLASQRGVALPSALLALLLLSVMIVGFSVLSSTEPIIANNQLLVAQARAIAEAGMERVVWALNNPTHASGIPDPLVTPPAPYDGSQPVPVATDGTGIGRFRVAVANGAAPNERTVLADGWVPNETASQRAKQRITVTLQKLRFPDPPAALTVMGEVQITGNAQVDSRADLSCGAKKGVLAADDVHIGGAGKIWGADGNNNANQNNGDYLQDQPEALFTPYVWTNAELDALKAYAQSRGTYYQGTVTFNSGNRLPNGLIFVDTTTGQNIDINGPNTTPLSEFADVTIHGNSPADLSGVFHGWIFVNGSLAIMGNFQMEGFAYAQNDFTYMGTGTGQIRGAVMSRNIRDTQYTNIDTPMGGNSLIVYDCTAAKTGGGFISQSWTVKPGTYREVSG